MKDKTKKPQKKTRLEKLLVATLAASDDAAVEPVLFKIHHIFTLKDDQTLGRLFLLLPLLFFLSCSFKSQMLHSTYVTLC